MSTQTARQGRRANDYIATERGAEGAVEYAFGVWKKRIIGYDRELKGSEAAISSAPAFTGLSYTAGNGALSVVPVDAYGMEMTGANAIPPKIMVPLKEYPGWRGFTYSYRASAQLQQTSNSSAPIGGAKRLFQYIQVPLFQSMYFFEHDLEIFFPAEMIVGGLVHTNSKMLVSGRSDSPLTFQGNVSYAGSYTSKDAPLGGPQWVGKTEAEAESLMSDPTYSTGYNSQVAKVDRYEPLGSKPAEVLDSVPAGADPANDSDGNPNNDSMRELIEPPSDPDNNPLTNPDPGPIANRRLYNKAGIVMKINANSVTITAQKLTTLTATILTDLQKAVYTSGTATVNRSTIYDKREGKNVSIVNVDMAKVTAALNASGVAGFNGVLYIHDTTPTNGGSPDPKTIRLQNGGVLPNAGLTVASENPVYIQGDYNTGTTNSPTAVPANSDGNPTNTSSPVVSGYQRKPSAVIADAVMFLSNSWNDAQASKSIYDSGTNTWSRVASNTTYNTAVLAGFIPSGWDSDTSSSSNPLYGYSGGANNFPRFLEYWGGRTCTYHGSMVELFRSKTFTGEWDTGDIYSPPKRRWNFDNQFLTSPPPGNVDAVAFSRGAYMRF